jgi:ferritin-like metal-binding protein YciE
VRIVAPKPDQQKPYYLNEIQENSTMSIDSLHEAFYEELRDIYHAEKQLLKALPKMAKAAASEKLKAAFNSHLTETAEHVERLEQAFAEIGRPARAKKCEAMEGLIKEASSCMEEDVAAEVLDALLIASAQKVEHYEIATYGTLCTWAKLLELDEALSLLKQNMSDEESATKRLTQLSKQVNATANV